MKQQFLLVLTISSLLLFSSCENSKLNEAKVAQIETLDAIEEDSAKTEIGFRVKREVLSKYGIATSEIAGTVQKMIFTKKLSIDSILNSTFLLKSRKGDQLEIPMKELIEIER
jgi:hypothetical protein